MINHRANIQRARSKRSGGSNAKSSATSDCQLLLDFDSTATLPSIVAGAKHDDFASHFALRFAALLETDPQARFDNKAVSQLAREIFGSSAGYARDAYDAAEAGFNIYLNRIGFDISDNRAAIDWLLSEQARLPLQSRRDQRQIEFQQFSTPPAQAFVVVKAAALRSGMSVLEPSAGTGNIAVLARLAGAQVDTNEIDRRRRDLLSVQDFDPTALDAERLDNVLPAEKSYHAIVMNPPFSATGGRVNGHRTAFGARHIEQALLRLRPRGRLVAIVGRGMALDRPAFRAWWEEISGRYHLRANIGIDGKEYSKFGTTFDNQIIVIDHDGPTSDLSAVITGGSLSVHQAFEKLITLSKEDVYGRVSRHEQKVGSRDTPSIVPTSGHTGYGSDRRASRQPLRGRSGRRHSTAKLFDHNGSVANLEPLGNGATTDTSPSGSAGDREGVARRAEGSNGASALGSMPSALYARTLRDDVGQLETEVAAQAVDIEEGTVFAAYRVQKAIVKGAHQSRK